MKVAQVVGPNIRACCAAARRHLELNLVESRERLRSGGEDGLWMVHLHDGTIVECTIQPRARTEVWGTYDQ